MSTAEIVPKGAKPCESRSELSPRLSVDLCGARVGPGICIGYRAERIRQEHRIIVDVGIFPECRRSCIEQRQAAMM